MASLLRDPITGLTPQEEKFCRFYVNEYANITDDGSDSEIALAAYRKAYNCKSDAKEKTHREMVSRLMSKKNRNIHARIEELRKAISEYVNIESAEIVSKNIKAYRLDPLQLLIFDEKLNRYRLRFMHEIPKHIRDFIPYKINSRGIVVPDVDRNAIQDRLIRVLGFEAAKKLDVSGNLDVNGEWDIFGMPEENEE